ncbi:MAG: type II toxin-antitoxin system RelE/ParE family toxin [Methanobacteriaceae archaeon]|jgi:mRNA interferase RelE/StbE
MPYSLEVADKAKEKLKKLSSNDKGLANRILKKIDQILEKPTHYDLLSGDLQGARKARAGDYRIIFEVYEDERMVMILDIGHRRDIYSYSNLSKINR